MVLALALLLFQAQAAPPTFHRDVAPILWQRCAACHRPGEVGPFALLRYADVRKRSEQILERVEAGAMPPWAPTGESLPFQDDRRLSPAEKDVLRRWVAAGAPEGALEDRREVPQFPEGWQLGTPDLVLEMPEAFVVPEDGPNLFRNFVVPARQKQGRWVRAVELRSDNSRAVHHAEVLLDKTHSARRCDARDAGVGFAGLTAGGASKPEGFFLGWTPGKVAREHPAGSAWRLPPAADLLLQLHLVPTGKPEPVRVKVGLWFAPEAPQQQPILARLGSTLIDIAPGVADYAIEDEFTLPVGAALLAVYPHAHFLARTMAADVVFPDGKRLAVLRIDDWDFNWQDEYRLAAPLDLPAGSRISMRFVYDNSTANPRHPAVLPGRVVFGPNSSDEMGDLWLSLLPRDAAEGARLAQLLGQKDLAARHAGFEAEVRRDPASRQARMGLASSFLGQGDLERARAEFARVTELEPGFSDAHFNLGVIAYLRKDLAAAVACYDRALAAQPEFPDAWNNRGAAMLALRDLVGAIESFDRALELDPEYADAHANLGILRARAGDLPQAKLCFERALGLDPEHVEANFNLGNVCLSQGDKARAQVQYQRTLEFAPTHAGAKAMLERVKSGK